MLSSCLQELAGSAPGRDNMNERVTTVGTIPELAAKEGFMYGLIQNQTHVLNVISNIQPDDPRIMMLLLDAISQIPDPEWRAKTKRKIDQELSGIPYNSEEGIAICLTCREMVTDWIQKTRPTVVWNLVGRE